MIFEIRSKKEDVLRRNPGRAQKRKICDYLQIPEVQAAVQSLDVASLAVRP
jgi:hypothetical protein